MKESTRVLLLGLVLVLLVIAYVILGLSVETSP